MPGISPDKRPPAPDLSSPGAEQRVVAQGSDRYQFFLRTGGRVDSRAIILKTLLLETGQGTVHIFREHLSPRDERACHPKPKYLRQVERNPCDAGATIWRTTT